MLSMLVAVLGSLCSLVRNSEQMDPRGTREAVGWAEMDQDKAKTPTEPTKEPAPDAGDFGELLITGMQELLGASDEDLRRWREQLVEHSRPS